jgi:hypothetical protein
MEITQISGAENALKVKTFALSDVRLLDSPFKQAMERNAAFLLSLDADRFLHNTRFARPLPDGALAAVRGDRGQEIPGPYRLHSE